LKSDFENKLKPLGSQLEKRMKKFQEEAEDLKENDKI
jgi:hypothetical protein